MTRAKARELTKWVAMGNRTGIVMHRQGGFFAGDLLIRYREPQPLPPLRPKPPETMTVGMHTYNVVPLDRLPMISVHRAQRGADGPLVVVIEASHVLVDSRHGQSHDHACGAICGLCGRGVPTPAAGFRRLWCYHCDVAIEW